LKYSQWAYYKTSSKVEVKGCLVKLTLEQAGIPPTLSVGEVARRSGVSVSTLHFYEAKVLISSRRTQGNQRRYTRDVLRRVAFIRVSQRVGIQLADIKAALATLPGSAAPTRADWARLSAAWRADLDERMEQLKKLRDTLDDCIGCGCLSIDRCRLRNPCDEMAAQGPGPRRLWVRRRATA
jgi:MerR family transcriptional regulator, redox-sensitive transcriptional activator SoxR